MVDSTFGTNKYSVGDRMEQRGTASAGKCRLADVGVVECIDKN
jgi:hypothetical protein